MKLNCYPFLMRSSFVYVKCSMFVWGKVFLLFFFVLLSWCFCYCCCHSMRWKVKKGDNHDSCSSSSCFRCCCCCCYQPKKKIKLFMWNIMFQSVIIILVSFTKSFLHEHWAYINNKYTEWRQFLMVLHI